MKSPLLHCALAVFLGSCAAVVAPWPGLLTRNVTELVNSANAVTGTRPLNTTSVCQPATVTVHVRAVRSTMSSVESMENAVSEMKMPRKSLSMKDSWTVFARRNKARDEGHEDIHEQATTSPHAVEGVSSGTDGDEDTKGHRIRDSRAMERDSETLKGGKKKQPDDGPPIHAILIPVFLVAGVVLVGYLAIHFGCLLGPKKAAPKVEGGESEALETGTARV
ncbi:hypothetical protein B0T20DRAFT_395159 [Sordaria brevicollis]|uniref:Transmembrane protein n=1 Tax=Sordaria brevicollis TaxID=83679 RepID=A0AAE0PB51_SORBR|nr:hypothetical protein B0T20DRAFT_395159 [Sordaria brevicollis]